MKVALKEVWNKDMNDMYKGPVTRSCEHGDERSATINSRTYETR
jgi:hypothetical protein